MCEAKTLLFSNKMIDTNWCESMLQLGLNVMSTDMKSMRQKIDITVAFITFQPIL